MREMTTFPSVWNIGLTLLLIHAFWISWVDVRHMIIPDAANISLGAAGLFFTWASGHSMPWQVIQIAFAGLLFWSIRWMHAKLREKVGLSLGDVKFAAAATAWTGLFALPWIVLVASIFALASLAILQMSGRTSSLQTRIPFGPHLCVGLLATWLALSYGYL
jgi:leader peptidase (prepilin peptidase) / N-methyltransferase